MSAIICLMLWLILPWLNRKNSLIAFQLKMGIILLKVAIPLDVVSFYKSCGRTRDGKRSFLIIVDSWEKGLPDLIFRSNYEKVENSISKTPPFDIWQIKKLLWIRIAHLNVFGFVFSTYHWNKSECVPTSCKF